MKKRILKKIRSERGASITFALLLFLVCMVLCSVMIVAASTAAGRISKIAESDREYYAVTSAAELIKELMESKTVKIEKIYEGTRTETYKKGKNGSTGDEESRSEIVSNYDESVYVFKLDGVTVNESDPKFYTLLSDVGYKYYKGGGTLALTIESSAEMKNNLGLSSGDDPLKVQIIETVTPNGDVAFTIGEDYKIILEFSMTKTATEIEIPGTRVTDIEPTYDEHGNMETVYTIETDMVKTKTETLTWTLSSIK